MLIDLGCSPLLHTTLILKIIWQSDLVLVNQILGIECVLIDLDCSPLNIAHNINFENYVIVIIVVLYM